MENAWRTQSANLYWSSTLHQAMWWGIVCAEVDKISLTVKQASFWGVRHVTRCIAVDCVKCYNGDMDKVLKNQRWESPNHLL